VHLLVCELSEHTFYVQKRVSEMVLFIGECGKKLCKVEQVRDANITWRMRFTCCITKATDTHSGYFVLRIVIFDGKNCYTHAPPC
jgi:hypothetical protein